MNIIRLGDILGKEDLRSGCHLLAHVTTMWKVVELGDKAIAVVDRMMPAKRWILMRSDILCRTCEDRAKLVASGPVIGGSWCLRERCPGCGVVWTKVESRGYVAGSVGARR